MIQIHVKKDPKTPEININISGHAEYADHGDDIVCAGVSAIAETTILGLQRIADEFPEYVRINIQEDE